MENQKANFKKVADYIRKQFYKKAVGPIRFVITSKEFKKTDVLLSSFSEQVNIAKVLTNTDKEIDLHQQKLNKMKEQKRH